tara:strand:+ start:249 stop:857 length:609 start_codon:yes stop_codon:yes gene_type:complete
VREIYNSSKNFNDYVHGIGTVLDLVLEFPEQQIKLLESLPLDPVPRTNHAEVNEASAMFLNQRAKAVYAANIRGYESALRAGLLSEENLNETLMSIPFRLLQKEAKRVGLPATGTHKALCKRLSAVSQQINTTEILQELRYKELVRIGRSVGVHPKTGRSKDAYVTALGEYYANLFRKIRGIKIGHPDISGVIKGFLVPALL